MNSNNYYEGYNPLWESNANKAFWCVLAIAILGLFGGIADTVLMTMAVGQVASDVVGSNASLPVSGSLVMSVLLKVAMVVVFGLYVWALDGFAQVQRRWEDARSVRQVKTAVIIQLICFILMMMIPLLLRVSPGVLGLWIVVWIMVLVSCFMMKDGFNNLKQSELLNQKAQLAAENLRYAAVCTLNLLIMPVVVAIILAVIGLLTLGSLDSIIGSFRYSGFGIDTLNSAGNTYNSAVDALQTAKVLGIFVLIASGLLGLYWGVVAFVYPMIGWYRMQHAGFEKLSAAPDTLSTTSTVSSSGESMQRLCGNCGSPVEDDALFCPKCGDKQHKTISPTEEKLPVSSPEIHPVKDDDVHNRSKTYLYYIIAAFVLFVLLVGIIFALMRSSSKSDEAQIEQTPITNAQQVVLYGWIGNYPVTMQLEISGRQVEGTYYYNSQGPDKRLLLSGSLDEETLDLYETDEFGNQTGHFRGYYRQEAFNGDFTTPQGKHLIVKLSETP